MKIYGCYLSQETVESNHGFITTEFEKLARPLYG